MMNKLMKMIAFCCCMGVVTGNLVARRGTSVPTVCANDSGQTRPITRREAERERRRIENYRKFSSHTPPVRHHPLLKRASWTLFKLLIGAGLGIGALVVLQNPIAAKAVLVGGYASAGLFLKQLFG